MAFDEIAGTHALGQHQPLVPYGAARGRNRVHGPTAFVDARPERQPRSVRAVEQVAVPDPGRDPNLLTSARAPHEGAASRAHVRPSSRSRRPRSKPTTTSPSMTVTGVAWYPSRLSSARAVGSACTSRSTNAIPF